MKKFAIVCLVMAVIVFTMVYFHFFRVEPNCNKVIYRYIDSMIQVQENQKEECKKLYKDNYKLRFCVAYPTAIEKVYEICNDTLLNILPPEGCNPTKFTASVILMENIILARSYIWKKLSQVNFSDRYMEDVLSLKLKPELKIEEIESKVDCQEFLDSLKGEIELIWLEGRKAIRQGISNPKTCKDAAYITQIFHKNLKESLEKEDLDNVTKYALITLGKAIEKCGYRFANEECWLIT